MWPIVGRWFSAGPLVPLMGLALLVLMIPALLFIQFIKRMLGIPLYPEPEMDMGGGLDLGGYFDVPCRGSRRARQAAVDHDPRMARRSGRPGRDF